MRKMTRLLHALKLEIVEKNDPGCPASFMLQGRMEHVAQICNVWKVDDNWWRRPTVRDYFKLQMESGLLCVIYHECLEDTWYLERIFD